MGNNEVSVILCKWQETPNNPDWFYVGCINQKVNVWKLAKKKHLTMIQIFQSCPYCGHKVTIKENK
jgi:hypothetical protein